MDTQKNFFPLNGSQAVEQAAQGAGPSPSFLFFQTRLDKALSNPV